MRFTALALLATAASVFAENFEVQVGQGGLTFTPAQVQAKDGDSITFNFVAKNHTVTQSSFANPCQRLASPLGVDSGHRAIPADPAAAAAVDKVWKITIANATGPLWFYCAQGTHCQAGMVFAVNPTAEKTFEQFTANAKAAPVGGAAPAPPAGASSAPPTAGATDIPGATPAAGATGASASSVPTGSVPTPAEGLPAQGQTDPVGAAANNSPLGNGAVRMGSSLTGLAAVAVVAMLL